MWPVRYEVTLRSLEGGERKVQVLTWLGQEKAIAMAVADHVRTPEASQIYDVSVRELGPAPKAAIGVVEIGRDLHDRMEF